MTTRNINSIINKKTDKMPVKQDKKIVKMTTSQDKKIIKMTTSQDALLRCESYNIYRIPLLAL